MRKLSVALLLCVASLPSWGQELTKADSAVLVDDSKRGANTVTGDIFVQDHAQILSPLGKQNLERLVQEYATSDHVQLAIVTVPSLHGRQVGDVGDSIKNALGVGNRYARNGILYLIAPNEHKQSIRVGRGLEAYLTDLMCKRILDQTQPKPGQNVELAITNRAQAILDHLQPDQAEITAEYEQALAQREYVQQATQDDTDEWASWLGFLALLGGGIFMALAAGLRRAQQVNKQALNDLEAWRQRHGNVEDALRGYHRQTVRTVSRQPFEGPDTSGPVVAPPAAAKRTVSDSSSDLSAGFLFGSLLNDSDSDDSRKRSSSSSSSSSTSFDFFDSSSNSDTNSFGGDSDGGGAGASSDAWE